MSVFSAVLVEDPALRFPAKGNAEHDPCQVFFA